MPLINVSQINQAQLALVVQEYASGAAFSGNMVNYVVNSGYIGPTALWVTGGSQDVTGVKTFRDSPRVPYSGTTGSAPSARWVNDQIAAASSSSSTSIGALSGYVQGASGALSYVRVTGSSTIGAANFTGLGGTLVIYSGGQIFISGAAAGAGGGSNVSVTGSSAISAPNLSGVGSVTVTYNGTYVLISGAGGTDASLSGYVEGNFVHRGAVDELVSGIKVFTGSPQVPNPTLPSGAANLSWVSGVSGVLQAAIGSAAPVTNVYNLSGITGNFVNMSFYLDEFGLTTGLNLFEAFVGRSFFFTGYALGTITSGTQGAFSGSLYQRTPTNVKTSFVNFGMPAGQFFSGRGGFSQEISGMNRVGLDIYLIGTGLTGVSVGAFGVGY